MAAIEIPPGIKPVGMNNKQMEMYHLKNGPGLRDTIAYKIFNKQEMIDEAIRLNFYSAWDPSRKDLEAFPGTEVLVIADPNKKYGENWYMCLSEATREAFFWVRNYIMIIIYYSSCIHIMVIQIYIMPLLG